MHTTIGWVCLSRYGTIVLTRRILFLGFALWTFLSLLCLVICPSLATSAIGICFVGLLLAVSFTDYTTLNIPQELIGGIGILACGAVLLGAPETISCINRCIGSCVASLPLLVCALAFHGFGGGDIKLMAAVGFLLGAQRALVALFLALAVGIGYALVLIITRKITLEDAFPFAPALSIGSFIAFLL